MDKSQLKYSQLAKLCIMVLLLLVTPFLSTSMRTPYLYFLLNLLIIVVGAEAGILSSSTSPEDKKYQPVPVVISSVTKPLSSTASTTITTSTTTLVETSPTKKTTDSTSTTTTTLVETSPNKKTTDSTSTTTTTLVETTPKKETTDSLTINNNVKTSEFRPESTETKVQLKKTMGKSCSEKTVRVVRVHKVKRSPSTPSLFFIGGGDTDHALEDKSSNVIIEEDVEEEVEEVEALSGQELYTKAEMFIGNFYKQLKIQREDSWKRLHDFYHKAF